MRTRKKGESKMTPRFPSCGFICSLNKYLLNTYYLHVSPLDHWNSRIGKALPQHLNDSLSSEENRQGNIISAEGSKCLIAAYSGLH